ncbi:Dynein associated protein [Ceratobasidium sp. AG-Ba]|nr:Dynein associated protein [Ceratobasidium sp. AG-Ba]
MQNEVPVDAVVDVAAGRGVVRFVGTTSFAPGKWVGIELNAPNGKNDGSVKDVAYFSCAPNHGVFVRPSQVKIISQPTSRPSSRAARGPPTPARQSSGRSMPGRSSSPATQPQPSPLALRTTSGSRLPSSKLGPPPSPITAVGRRPTLSGGTHKRSGSFTAAQSPLAAGKPVGTKAVPNTSSSSSLRPTPTNEPDSGDDNEDITITRLPLEMRPPAGATPSNGIAPSPQLSSSSRLAASPALDTSRLPPGGASPSRIPSATLSSSPAIESPLSRLPGPKRQPSSKGLGLSQLDTSTATTNNLAAPGPTTPSPNIPPSPKPAASPSLKPIAPPSPERSREDVELRAKLRVLETKRQDDARHIRELETKLADAETFVAIRPKLQAKLQSLQTELSQTKRELADQQAEMSTLDEQKVEASEQLEMVMLDKEMAEERAEIAEAEVEALKERLAVLEVELQAIKEGGTEGGGGESDGKKRLDVLQLEKHNERLKEALIKLRDLTHETDVEQKRKITELERELSGVDELQTSYEETLTKLTNADAQIEDLKIQLDDALGAEEMLVQLTDRNLMLSEKIEEMRVIIEDLEALKELNDEIEENHVEAERAMQEEIDAKDSAARDLNRKIESLEETIADYEGTITQFRELVVHLQSDLDTLREENQIHQTESSAQASQSAAIMSLNMRLQSSAAKNQAKNIEFELRKLDAAQAREWLGIVQPYLPQVYVEADADATACYMFFQRLAWKSELVANVVGSANGLPESLAGSVPESLVGVCEMRGRVYHFACLCKRFAAVLRKCDVQTFHGVGRLYPDLLPMEKRLDMHVDLLRRDEFRIMECVSDVSKMLAQFEHLADTAFSGFDADLAERELDLTMQLDCDLDSFVAAIGLTKTALENSIKDEDTIVEYGDLDVEQTLFEPMAQVLEQSKSAKVAFRKLVRRVEDLIQDNSALKGPIIPKLSALTTAMVKGCDFGIQLAQRIGAYLADVRAQKHDFQLAAVLSHVRETVAETLGQRTTASWEAVGQLVASLIKDANAAIEPAMEPENAPWTVRIAEVKALSAVNVDAERTVNKLNEEIKDLIRGIKTRDQTIQETSVKIELMERRMETVKKQADAIVDLEGDLAKARRQEKVYEEAMEQLQNDLDELEQENAKLKQASAVPDRNPAGIQPTNEETVVAGGDLEASHLLEQIESLRGAVRFLRHENSYLKSQDLLRELHALPSLASRIPPPTPLPARRPTVTRPRSPASSVSDPELDRGSHSETESEESLESPPPSPRTLVTESKLLYRDLLSFAARPRVVDLSAVSKPSPKPLPSPKPEGEIETTEKPVEEKPQSPALPNQPQTGRRGWVRQHLMPAQQLAMRRAESQQLERRVRGLAERAGQLGIVKLHG